MVRKACRDCKRLMEKGSECEICKGQDLTTDWKGMVVIYDPEHSDIAEKVGVSTAGRYAVMVNP